MIPTLPHTSHLDYYATILPASPPKVHTDRHPLSQFPTPLKVRPRIRNLANFSNNPRLPGADQRGAAEPRVVLLTTGNVLFVWRQTRRSKRGGTSAGEPVILPEEGPAAQKPAPQTCCPESTTLPEQPTIADRPPLRGQRSRSSVNPPPSPLPEAQRRTQGDTTKSVVPARFYVILGYCSLARTPKSPRPRPSSARPPTTPLYPILLRSLRMYPNFEHSRDTPAAELAPLTRYGLRRIRFRRLVETPTSLLFMNTDSVDSTVARARRNKPLKRREAVIPPRISRTAIKCHAAEAHVTVHQRRGAITVRPRGTS